MIKNRCHLEMLGMIAAYCLVSCNSSTNGGTNHFENMTKQIEIGHWRYKLRVEEQRKMDDTNSTDNQQHFLKATIAIGNSKIGKSLLYSASRSTKDYEANYKYLAFKSNNDLYIKCKNQKIFPVGYVFEPSNGLNPEERLVYKFVIMESSYDSLQNGSSPIEYWYTDNITRNGKICFNTNN